MTNNPVDAEWVAPLLRAQEVLAAGPDPAATLEAIASVLLPFQPAFIDLAILHPPIGITVFNGATGKQELVNRAGAALIGTEIRDDLTGYSPIFYPPGEAEPVPPEQWPFTLALQTGKRQERELEMTRPDGSRSLFDITATPLRFEDDPVPRIVILYQASPRPASRSARGSPRRRSFCRPQALALAERSTPLIPIRRDVLVMPLVGSIDAERGRQILETLVHFGGASDIRAAIIDVTGAKNLDTAAAHALISAVRALRLRGVQPVITGIQQDAAMTLVQMGVDFCGILVRGTLQDGVDAVIKSKA